MTNSYLSIRRHNKVLCVHTGRHGKMKCIVLYENSLTWLFASRKVQPSLVNYAVLSPVRRKAAALAATFMKPIATLIILLLTTFLAKGQAVQIDTILSKVKSVNVDVHNKDFLQASKGAENYINSLLGDTFYHDHVKINFKQTEIDNFEIYVGKSGDAKLLESQVYYNIHYYLIDNVDTLSYFDLLVDRNGIPTKFDKDFSFSSPTKLLISYQNLFSNKLKVDFFQAVVITKQHGFQNKPFLNYQIEDDMEKLIWRVSYKQADGKRRVLDINADNGEIKEFYFPSIEQ